MNFWQKLFGHKSSQPTNPISPPSPAPATVSNEYEWLRPQVQAQCKQRAQSGLGGEDEQIALKLAALYKQYDKVCNLRTDEEKAECERIKTEAAEIGKKLCGNGGAKRMLTVAFRAELHGARMRSIELFWDGICGWSW